jgi:hypothetical protein
MISEEVTMKLKPVVRFREFPFGTTSDPSMRDFMGSEPYPNQDKVLAYLRSGLILAYPMGADLLDWLDLPNKANPWIEGRRLGGVTPLTDGEWFWYAGLIHFVEKYNVRLPQEFLDFAGLHGWRVEKDRVPRRRYDFSYFDSLGR